MNRHDRRAARHDVAPGVAANAGLLYAYALILGTALSATGVPEDHMCWSIALILRQPGTPAGLITRWISIRRPRRLPVRWTRPRRQPN